MLKALGAAIKDGKSIYTIDSLTPWGSGKEQLASLSAFPSSEILTRPMNEEIHAF